MNILLRICFADSGFWDKSDTRLHLALKQKNPQGEPAVLEHWPCRWLIDGIPHALEVVQLIGQGFPREVTLPRGGSAVGRGG